MRIRRLLALAVSVALVVSLTLTGCCTGTTDSSGEVLDALVSLFHTQYEDQITVTHSQWIGDVLASALKNNSSEAAVNDALSSIMSCSKNDFEDLASSVADKDHAHDLVVLSTSTNTPSAAARNAFDQWTSTLGAIVQKDGDYTADLAVMQTNGDYYILLHFKVGDVADPPVTDPDPDPEPDPEPDPDNRFHIDSVEDLFEFADLVNSGKDQYIDCVLDTDLDLRGVSWIPVGNPEGYTFLGTFDGNGYTISNLTVLSSTTGYAGLFGGIGTRAKVENLTLANVSIHVTTTSNIVYKGSAGALVGMNSGFIYNCHVIGGTVEGRTVGGLVGRNETVSNLSSGGIIESGCSVSNLTITAIGDDAYAGGIVGLNKHLGRLFDSFTVDGRTTIKASGNKTAYAGGVIGYNASDSGNIGNRFAGWSVNISGGNITAAVGPDSVCVGESDSNGAAYAGSLIGYNANEDYDLGPINQ